jgi:hypothetical protein
VATSFEELEARGVTVTQPISAPAVDGAGWEQPLLVLEQPPQPPQPPATAGQPAGQLLQQQQQEAQHTDPTSLQSIRGFHLSATYVTP